MDPELEAELLKLKRQVVKRVHERRGAELSEDRIASIQLNSPLEDYSPPVRKPPVRHAPRGTQGAGPTGRSRSRESAQQGREGAMNLLRALGALSLWTPSGVWGSYVANSDGRHTLGQASTLEWLVFWALVIAPYFVIARWIKAGSD